MNSLDCQSHMLSLTSLTVVLEGQSATADFERPALTSILSPDGMAMGCPPNVTDVREWLSGVAQRSCAPA